MIRATIAAGLLAAWATVFTSAAGQEPPSTPQPVAIVLQAEGGVVITRAASRGAVEEKTKAAVGAPLYRGDKLDSDDKGKAVLLFVVDAQSGEVRRERLKPAQSATIDKDGRLPKTAIEVIETRPKAKPARILEPAPKGRRGSTVILGLRELYERDPGTLEQVRDALYAYCTKVDRTQHVQAVAILDLLAKEGKDDRSLLISRWLAAELYNKRKPRFGSGNLRIDDLRKDMGKVAQEILAALDREHRSTIAVGGFTGPPQLGANFGPGVEELLSQSLEGQREGVVRKRGELSVRGSYALVDDPQSDGSSMVKLTFEVSKGDGERLKQFVAELRSTADIARICGATVSLDPDGTKEERNREIKDRLAKPKVQIDGARVQASADSKLAVEIRAKPKDSKEPARARLAKDDDGLAYVDLKRDEEYEIVIHNKSDKEAAVSLQIDGLDIFAFSEVRDPKTKQPKYSHYIVGPRSQLAIRGWHLSNRTFSPFSLTDYSTSAAGHPPRAAQGKTGVLTASFAYTSPAGSRGGDATGFGPPPDAKRQPVERDVDPPHEFVSVRFER
jgi:hypothetical protein